ncbi:MAG: radical SAM protein [Anaerolineaceae bacterium]|nr:radical SAM protein [Anaerolineaceae bacterium]
MEKLRLLNDFPSDEVDECDRPGISEPAGCMRSAWRREAAESIKDPARQSIHRAILPGGGNIPLLKTMQTSICENNCRYCGYRSERDIRRVTFSPDEMVRTFLALQRAGVVKGLFLSSGVINGGTFTQDRILATAELLRKRYHFQGYLHLKLMPGSQRAQLEQAILLADRVSINLESPNAARLAQLAPQKKFELELLLPFQWMNEIQQTQDATHAWRGRWPSMTTQFVVGGVGESDLELLQTTFLLTRQYRLSRAYFSGFKPVTGTPLEGVPQLDPWREYRLYQASYLMKDYGYDLEELSFDQHHNLPSDHDPKVLWAEQHLANHPIEVNQADRRELLRIPGIGPKGVESLLRERARGSLLTEPGQLRKLGIQAERAMPYILINGRRPDRQPALF